MADTDLKAHSLSQTSVITVESVSGCGSTYDEKCKGQISRERCVRQLKADLHHAKAELQPLFLLRMTENGGSESRADDNYALEYQHRLVKERRWRGVFSGAHRTTIVSATSLGFFTQD